MPNRRWHPFTSAFFLSDCIARRPSSLRFAATRARLLASAVIAAGDDVRRLQPNRGWRPGSGFREKASRYLDPYNRTRLLAPAVNWPGLSRETKPRFCGLTSVGIIEQIKP